MTTRFSLQSNYVETPLSDFRNIFKSRNLDVLFLQFRGPFDNVQNRRKYKKSRFISQEDQCLHDSKLYRERMGKVKTTFVVEELNPPPRNQREALLRLVFLTTE